MQEPRPGEIYRHFKDGLYQIVGVAQHTETEEKMVVYQALYGGFKLYVRPLAMFMSEVDRNKYPDTAAKYRFEKVNVNDGQDSSEPALKRSEENRSRASRTEDLERFFDAGTYKEKIEVLDSLEDTVTDSMLDSMAVSMDINLPEGQVYERFMALKRTLQMMRQYEGHRE